MHVGHLLLIHDVHFLATHRPAGTDGGQGKHLKRFNFILPILCATAKTNWMWEIMFRLPAGLECMFLQLREERRNICWLQAKQRVLYISTKTNLLNIKSIGALQICHKTVKN